jgi:hypothetical protein
MVDLPVQTEDAHLLMVLYRTESGSGGLTYLDDSSEAHPARTVRVLNLAGCNLAADIGSGPRVVRPRNNVLLGDPVFQDADRFHFSYDTPVAGQGFWESSTQRLRFRREDPRLLIVYTMLPSYVEVDIEQVPDSGREADIDQELDLDRETEFNREREIEVPLMRG